MNNAFERRSYMKYYDKFYARSAFSRFFLGYSVLYLLLIAITAALPFVLVPIISLLPTDAAKAVVDVVGSISFGMFFPYVVMYLIGLPIMYLFIKGTRTRKKEKSSLGFGMLLTLFFISCTFSLVGSVAGNFINSLLDTLLDRGSTGSIFDSIPLWALSILTLFIAPIFEEIIFRKLLIDRIGVYGDRLAIVVSGLAFGAFHGTVEQLFYTTFVGMIFAFAYVKTGRIRYPIILHFFFNLFGGVIPMLISEYWLYSESALLAFLGVGTVFLTRFGFAIAGLVLFIVGLCRGWFSIYNSTDTVRITSSRPRIMFFNFGCLLFFFITLLSFASDIFPLTEWIYKLLGVVQ